MDSMCTTKKHPNLVEVDKDLVYLNSIVKEVEVVEYKALLSRQRSCLL
jgi:hypothetical protein